jgi:hypothetical protein
MKLNEFKIKKIFHKGLILDIKTHLRNEYHYENCVLNNNNKLYIVCLVYNIGCCFFNLLKKNDFFFNMFYKIRST